MCLISGTHKRIMCNLLIFGYCIRERNCLPLYLIKIKMKIQRFLYIFLATVVTQITLAQGILRGTVVDKETHEPIIGATISDAKRSRPLTVTDTEGRFIIPKNGDFFKFYLTFYRISKKDY